MCSILLWNKVFTVKSEMYKYAGGQKIHPVEVSVWSHAFNMCVYMCICMFVLSCMYVCMYAYVDVSIHADRF